MDFCDKNAVFLNPTQAIGVQSAEANHTFISRLHSALDFKCLLMIIHGLEVQAAHKTHNKK